MPALHAAFADPANRDAMRLMKIAICAAYHGDSALALDTLRCSCLEARGGVPFRVIRMWLPIFAEVRKTDGFKQFVRDIGLYDYWRKSGEWGDFARPLGDDDFEIIK